MKNIFFCINFIIFSFALLVRAQPHYGVVITPIADLLGAPIKTFFPHDSVNEAYKQLVLCGAEKKIWQGCPRLHQLIANEIVEVIDENEHELKIKTPHLFYLAANSSEKQNTFWTHKKNIALLTDLQKKHDLDISNFPFFNRYKTIIVLSRPFKNPTTNITYSVGTQFVAAQLDHNHHAHALLFDAEKNKFNLIKIDAGYFFIKPKSLPEQQILFLNLLRGWAQQHYIAYVWGGCSFTQTCTNTFAKTTNKQNNSYWRPESEHIIKNGFDCAGIILRAAQAAGLNYPYKNTHTLKECLSALTNHDHLVEGDLIWIPGHVMAVSNLTKNLLIEARSYSHGYGIVHEIPLEKVFKNIHTYQDLIHAYHKKEILYRLDDQGNVRDTFKEFKLLKMIYQ